MSDSCRDMPLSLGQLRGHIDNGRAVLRAHRYLRPATQLGPLVRVWGRPAVANDGTLIIHDKVRIMSTIATVELAVGRGGFLEIGERTFINNGASIGATLSIRIGANCSIGTHAMVFDNDFHRVEPERRDERPDSAPIVLEDNVWLGARAIVLRGVTIGQGSVVGAGSVVAHDVEPRSLVAGLPAKLIRKL